MRTCEACGRRHPEVVGAEEQRCPFCGTESPSVAPVAGEPRGVIVDPVGALGEAWRFLRRRYPLLLLLWIPVIVADALSAFAVVAYQERLGLGDLGALSTDEALALLGVAAPVYFVDFAVTFAAWSLVAAAVLDHAAGGGNLARSWAKRAPGALLVGALMTVALVAGLVLAFVPFLVFLHLFLFAPAAHAAGARPGAAFEESRRFGREHATYGFTALVVLALGLLVAVEYAFSLASPGWLAGVGVTSPYLVALVDLAPAWLLGPVLPVLPAAYRALAARERARGADAPADAAPPEDRTRTTKCPSCGALVPYEPGPGPTLVTCPACGTRGRVL